MNKLSQNFVELESEHPVSASTVIGSKLRRFRKTLGLTGAELGEIINCSQQHVSRIESGVSKLNIEQIYFISKKTEISMFHLLQGIGYEDRSSTYAYLCNTEHQANTITYLSN